MNVTEEEILAYNKRSAEFLGWTFTTFKEIYHFIADFEGNQYTSLEDLKFHSDWNWIMEVRDKILSINSYSATGQRFIFNINACAKYNRNENDKPYKVRIKGVSISYPMPFIEVNSFNEKEAVVEAINQFLIWYNKNYKRLQNY